VGAGDFENALQAFDKIIDIEGEHAELLGAKAQATYYMNNQKIDQAVQELIDRALALDPNDPSTNILLGMNSFVNQQYQNAINYWQRVVDNNQGNVNATALREAIAEAKNRLSLVGGTVEESNQVAAQNDVDQGPQLTLNISLTDEIIEALSQGEDKVVFVYATPNDGRRMPVAAVKIKASDLPTTIVLNNSRAMSPQANLSSVENVHLYAVISSQGGVGIKSGDFKAQQLNVAVTTTDVVELVIDTIVP
jgi:cytochrome c-type biogenesis protein CcmH